MTKNQIGQYLNLDGVFFNLKYLFKLRTIKPDIYSKSITNLDLNELKKKHKINYIVFDKDNTLTMPHINKLANEEIRNKINEFKFVFGEDNLAILSNSAGSRDDLDYKEANEIESNTLIQVIKHEYKKPRVYKEILESFSIKDDNKANSQICVIGDRLLVDVIMGKQYGFFTILVEPITLSKDNYVVRMLRLLEAYLIKRNFN